MVGVDAARRQHIRQPRDAIRLFARLLGAMSVVVTTRPSSVNYTPSMASTFRAFMIGTSASHRLVTATRACRRRCPPNRQRLVE